MNYRILGIALPLGVYVLYRIVDFALSTLDAYDLVKTNDPSAESLAVARAIDEARTRDGERLRKRRANGITRGRIQPPRIPANTKAPPGFRAGPTNRPQH